MACASCCSFKHVYVYASLNHDTRMERGLDKRVARVVNGRRNSANQMCYISLSPPIKQHVRAFAPAKGLPCTVGELYRITEGRATQRPRCHIRAFASRREGMRTACALLLERLSHHIMEERVAVAVIVQPQCRVLEANLCH